MKAFFFLLFMLGMEGEVIPGGGSRTSGEYTIKHDRITIMPSGELRSREYTALSGSRRFLESTTPVIYFVIPSEVEKDKVLDVGIGGEGFLSYPSPPRLFIGHREIRNLKIYGSSSIVWTYPGDMTEGIYDVKVVNNDGRYAIKKDGFKVKSPSIELYRVIPSSIYEGEKGDFVLNGKNFKEGITVTLGPFPASVSRISETSIEFSVAGLERGIYDLYAFSPDGISASINSAVQVVRKGRHTTVERGGCGCYEVSPSGIFSFVPFIILFLIRRKKFLPLCLVFILSCGGKKTGEEVRENLPPVAEAGENRELSLYEWIRLDGKASSDPDGDELEFLWSMSKAPDGAVYYLFDAKTAEPLFMTETPGEYEVALIVSDGSLKSMPDYVTLTVKGEGEVPVARVSSVVEGIGGVLQLSAEDSFDPNGKPLIYRWEFINPPSCQSYRELAPVPNPLIPVECPKGTVYKFLLTVSDGKFSSAPFEITAVVPDSPPVLSYLEDITLPSGADFFELSAEDIYDPDGDEVRCTWKVEKKPVNANVSPSVSNACTQRFSLTGSTDGYYLFLLQVSDGERVLTQWVNVSVGKPSPPFISSFSLQPEIFLDGNSWIADVDVECSIEKGFWGGSESFVKYRFELGDFPEDVSFTFLTPSEGYISSFSIPVTASIEIRGKIRNMDEPVVKGRIGCVIMGEEANYPFVSEKWEPLIFAISNSIPYLHIPDHSISLNDDVFQYAIIKARGYDADGDIISYRWSILYSPDGAVSFISQPYGDEAAFFAGYGEGKKGVYLIRTVVMDEHGASSYDDFSVVIK